MGSKWEVQVKGSRTGGWEISVVREDNLQGKESWGLFGEDKILISAGGMDGKPLHSFVWELQNRIAQELCDILNSRENKSEGPDIYRLNRLMVIPSRLITKDGRKVSITSWKVEAEYPASVPTVEIKGRIEELVEDGN